MGLQDTKQCLVAECGVTLLKARGYCKRHYEQGLREGWLPYRNLCGQGSTTEERFWSRVTLTADDSRCWDWLASTNQDGYGRISVKGDGKWGRKNIQAHHYAFFLVNKKWPTKLLLHSCDNPKCVNPNHLREGTDADNMRDRDSKGRVSHGERHFRARLVVPQVRVIKHLLKTEQNYACIGRYFGVTAGAIRSIAIGESWKRVVV